MCEKGKKKGEGSDEKPALRRESEAAAGPRRRRKMGAVLRTTLLLCSFCLLIRGESVFLFTLNPAPGSWSCVQC